MIRAMLCAAALAAGVWAANGSASTGAGAVQACCAPGAACCDAGDVCCFDAGFVAFRDEKKPAGEKPAAKEVKVTGTLVCGKCALSETKKCTNVLQVKEKDKTVNYYLDDKGAGEEFHEGVCGGGKLEGVTVTGAVTEKDGKKFIKPTKVDVKK